jgi:hypothetical protein
VAEPLRPELRALIEKAVHEAPLGPCEVCGRGPAAAYGFAFAKKPDLTRWYASWGTMTLTELAAANASSPVETRTVNLCDDCVRRQYGDEQERGWWLTIGVAGVWVVLAIGVWLTSRDTWNLPVWSLAIVVIVPVALLILLTSRWRDRRRARDWRSAGSSLAVSLYQQRCDERDIEFWTLESLSG